MVDMPVLQVSVADLFATSTPIPSLSLPPYSMDVHAPSKQTTTTSGLPVLALYKGKIDHTIVYLLVIRETRGFIFDHYYYETDMVQVSSEKFSLSWQELKEIEKFLSGEQHVGGS